MLSYCDCVNFNIYMFYGGTSFGYSAGANIDDGSDNNLFTNTFYIYVGIYMYVRIYIYIYIYTVDLG